MADKITILDDTKAYHIFQPTDSRRWLNYRVNDYGCEIAEYEDIGNGEVKKYSLACFQKFQWVKQDKIGIEPEIIKTQLKEESPALDPFTQAALEERGEDDIPDYTEHLSTDVSRETKPDIVEQYNEIKAASDARKPKGQCHHCGTEFTKGHPSKKFCNSKCKDAFHNSKREKT